MNTFLDILFSALCLILLSPFLIIGCLLILLLDGPPVIFAQNRLGLNRRVFTLYKFRTMNDEKITSLGNLLRSTGFDELSQLFNILKGEMSFIGPRPLTDKDVARLGWDNEKFYRRWDVKPGITGVAQLSPICDSSLAYSNDIYYIENKSIALDLKIILATFGILMGAKNPVNRPKPNR